MAEPRTRLAGLQSIVTTLPFADYKASAGFTPVYTHTWAVASKDKLSSESHLSEYSMCLKLGCPKWGFWACYPYWIHFLLSGTINGLYATAFVCKRPVELTTPHCSRRRCLGLKICRWSEFFFCFSLRWTSHPDQLQLQAQCQVRLGPNSKKTFLTVKFYSTQELTNQIS